MLFLMRYKKDRVQFPEVHHPCSIYKTFNDGEMRMDGGTSWCLNGEAGLRLFPDDSLTSCSSSVLSVVVQFFWLVMIERFMMSFFTILGQNLSCNHNVS